MSDPQPALGAAVRALRKQAGLTQDDLAARAELPRGLISEIETGLVDPTWGDMRRLSAALGTTVDKLAEEAERLEQPED